MSAHRHLALALLLFAFGCAVAPRTHVLFDDFTYRSTSELEPNGWIMRTEAGWPGVPGSAWGPESFSMHDDPARAGNRLLRMTSQTAGSGATTRQSQLCHQRKYLDGTYAARVRFTDAPAEGPNGDKVVETFYLISPLKAPMDPDYSEVDFEYLPNGGWGHTGPTFFETTWKTFQLEPWTADNTSSNRAGALEGWHTLVAQASGGVVRYFVDGEPVAEHGGKFYPRVMMSINFNLWFIRDQLAPATEMRRWIEEIDWVYFRDGAPMSSAEVLRDVDAMRRRSVAFRDTVPASGLSSPCNF